MAAEPRFDRHDGDSLAVTKFLFPGSLGTSVTSVLELGANPLIPPFRDDGYLPEGVHISTEAEVTFRFGSPTSSRRRLALRLRRWLELARLTYSLRFLVDGSFVTSKENPNDLDAVVLLADDFEQQVLDGRDAAIELEEMLLSRYPEEIFAAEDSRDWREWVEFFSRTRERDSRLKGLVEVEL